MSFLDLFIYFTAYTNHCTLGRDKKSITFKRQGESPHWLHHLPLLRHAGHFPFHLLMRAGGIFTPVHVQARNRTRVTASPLNYSILPFVFLPL